ncbi:MAG: hypothetical protein KC421_12905 [Anaerolineales bacterium]|nr:hypothetical protein [Anaerolineales bacterium]
MRSHPKKSKSTHSTQTEKRQPYEKPAIVFEGTVTTRAGSPLEPAEEEFDLIKFLSGNVR